MFISQNKDFIRLDRRKFLGVAGALIAAGVLPKSALALAGPKNFKHGVFDVTVVSDGTVMIPLSIVSPDAKPEELKALLGTSVVGENNKAELNVTLLKSGSDVILFDTGTGANQGIWPDGGQIIQSLQTSGVAPADVTKVIYTHAHPDHLFGTMTADGKEVFPNASYHMSETELNFWLLPDLASKMPPEWAPIVKATQGILGGLRPKFATFKAGAEVLPGIGVIDTAGHTPGHVSFELAGDDGLVLVGDAINTPAVFFAHPEWKFGFDADADLAGKTRRSFLDYASHGKKKLLGYHWTYPGLGMAEVKDGAFAYVPAA